MPEPKSIQSMWSALQEVADYGTDKKEQVNQIQENNTNSGVNEEQVDPAEDIVVEFLEGFLGDSINESTSEDDQNEAILEAVASLNNICAIVNEYFETTEAYQYAVESLQQEG